MSTAETHLLNPPAFLIKLTSSRDRSKELSLDVYIPSRKPGNSWQADNPHRKEWFKKNQHRAWGRQHIIIRSTGGKELKQPVIYSVCSTMSFFTTFYWPINSVDKKNKLPRRKLYVSRPGPDRPVLACETHVDKKNNLVIQRVRR